MRLERSLALLALAWLVIATMHAAFFKELLYDDAFNASVAKNFALGQGWVSSYHDYLPFNPRVTTGPTLLMPLAASIALAGNPEWLPNIVNAVLMTSLLCLCLHQLRRLMPESGFWPLMLGILILLSLYDRNTWVVFIGDGVIALLLILAALRMGPSLRLASPYHFLVLGLLAGLTVLSKVYALIALTALPICWLCYQLRQGDAAGWKQIGWMACGFLALLLPWQIYQQLSLAQLSAAAQLEHAEYSREFFMSGGSGVGQFLAAEQPLAHLWGNFERNFSALAKHLQFHGMGPLVATGLLVAIAAICLHLLVKDSKTDLHWSLLALALAAGAHLGWYLLFTHNPWSHYLRIPLMISIFLLPTYLSRLMDSRTILAAVVVLVMLLPVGKTDGWKSFMALDNTHSAGSRDLAALVVAVEELDYAEPLAGCGWLVLRMLEYRLQGSGHMQDCMLLLQQALPPEVSLKNTDAQRNRVLLTRPVIFTIPMHNQLWAWAGRGHRQERDIKRYCGGVIYESPTYSLLHCEVNEISPELADYLRQYKFRS